MAVKNIEVGLRREVCRVVNEAPEGVIQSMTVYGSLVRGDFWPKQSDVDLLVETRTASPHRDVLAASFEAIADAIGVLKIEPWIVDRQYLKSERRRAFCNRASIQFGLHGFDTVDFHKTICGSDPIAGFPVACETEDLLPLAKIRLVRLYECDLRCHPSEAPKWACEAVKAAQLLFGLPRGTSPTRHKDRSLENFCQHVPSFEGKGFVRELWANYKAGPAQHDATYAERCSQFVKGLADLARSTD